MIATKKGLLLLVMAAALILAISQGSFALQLLANPSFESGVPSWNGDSCGGSALYNSWTYSSINPYAPPQLCTGIWDSGVTAWYGGTRVHQGASGVRAFSYGYTPGYWYASISQTVDAAPSQSYTGSAWIYIWSSGVVDPSLFAKLEIQELDAGGLPVGAAHVVPYNDSNVNAWLNPSLTFPTSATTAKLEFKLSCYSNKTLSADPYMAHFNFDDCSLVGPDPSAKIVQGTVTSGGTPLAGATVTCASDTATTNAEGKYSFEVPGATTSVTVRASKTAYFAQRQFLALTTQSTIADFVLNAVGANVLKNPGFDDCTAHLPYTAAPDSWSVTPVNMFGKESFWTDSGYEGYPAYLRSGAEAGGIFASALAGATVPGKGSIGQTATVLPSSPYTAKVWVRTYDDGLAWYDGSDQKASLVIEQLNWGGAVIDTHTEYVSTFYDWQQLSYGFTTLANTAMVRISGRANLINDYDATFARAVFDDFELNGAAGPAMPDLFGMVTSGGAPLAGATVSLPYASPLDLSTTTAADGSWRLNPGPTGLYVDVSKAGYYSARAVVTSPRLTPLNFDLVEIGNNLLTNAGFDGPDPKGGWSEQTFGPGNGYARDEANWVGPAQILSNYNAMALLAAYNLPAGQWIYQRVPVVGGTTYTAKCMTKIYVSPTFTSVWGDLFDTQLAGLRIQEYSAAGSPIGDPVLVTSQELKDWEPISTTFQANPNTATIAVGPYVYMTESGLAAGAGYGNRAVFDNVEMNGQLGPWGLSGTVRAGGAPVVGANVAVQVNGAAATYYITDALGRYTATVPYGATCSIRVNKAGFYPLVKSKVITGEMAVDFDLFEVDGNLMFNPNFDDPAGWSSGGWVPSAYALPESNTASWGPAYFFSVPQAVYMRGGGVSSTIYQDVPVQPGKSYTASVQFRPTQDPRYSSVWGVDPLQTGGLSVQKLDATKAAIGAEVQTLATVTVDNRDQWQLLTNTIAADSNTRYLRVGAFSHMVDNYDANLARALFDNFSLTGDAVPSAKIADLKKLDVGAAANMTGKIVTAKFNGYFYAEESDRASGIRVTGDANVGDRVDVLGTMGTVGGERIINSTNVIQRSSGFSIAPLGMNGRSAKTGLSAVGLYLTVWGKVSTVDTAGGFFTMSDGSQESLKVYGSATADDYVEVTGALGAEMSGTVVTPVMRSVTVTKVME